MESNDDLSLSVPAKILELASVLKLSIFTRRTLNSQTNDKLKRKNFPRSDMSKVR